MVARSRTVAVGTVEGTQLSTFRELTQNQVLGQAVRILFAPSSIDVRKQPTLGGGLCGGLGVILSLINELKQSLRIGIRWLHGPPSNRACSSTYTRQIPTSPYQ